MNFIQVFDFKTLTLTHTVQASKLIYKMIPIDTKYILCAGSYILELFRTSDHKMLEVCKFENSIYDVCLVQTLGMHIDYALATWEGV